MGQSVLARRYARALYAIAKARNSVPATGAGLAIFDEAVQRVEDLRVVLARDRIVQQTRLAVMREVAAALQCSALVTDFLQLLIQKKRAQLLPDILAAFTRFAHLDSGTIVAHVTTATPVADAALLTAIQNKMAEVYSRTVQLTTKVDDALLGGVMVRVGDEVFDGSIATALRRMRRHLMQAA